MVVVVLLDFGEVADERHLDCALGACTHARDVAFESVVFIDYVDCCTFEECLERRYGNVQLHFDAWKQRSECGVDFFVERFDFVGLPVASRRD